MAISDKTKPIVIYAPIEVKEKLERLAKADGRSVSNYMLQVIEKIVAK
jgi:predicted DNA-binding protein